MCVDKADLTVYGDLTAKKASIIFVDVVKCSGHQIACKSDEEIKTYFNFKNMFVLSN